ncbi:hypothetical protein EJB05_25767, partial [Eragrostis curvula]
MVPMEIVRLIPFVLGTLKIPINLYKGDKKLERQMKHGLDGLMYELESLMHDLESNKEDWKSFDELRLTDLVYEIEDFAQDLWIPGASGPLLSAIGINPVGEYVNRIKGFKDKIKELKDSKQRGTEWKSPQGGCSSADATSSSDPASSSAAGGYTYTPEKSLVGIEKPKEVILQLLKKQEASEDQAGGQDAVQRPKVISIVGCPGVGKTALARVVYDHYYVEGVCSHEFGCVAWVEAAGCNNKKDLLAKIRDQVQADLARRASGTTASPDLKGKGKADLASEASSSLGPSNGDGTATSPDLKGMLAGKRYLVFIDDMQQAKVWKDIVCDFPGSGKSSILIVTTSVHSVADVCSSGSYVYRMQCLPLKQSEDLFWRHVYPGASERPQMALRIGSESILSKCGGLPLALISVAGHLSIKAKNLDRADCVQVGEELGNHYLAGIKAEEQFRKLRRALWQCYDDLPESDHKTCMLSLSIFPMNHPIRSKTLVRRLVAEGLIAGDDTNRLYELNKLINHGKKCLDELINRCIVEPVKISSCSKDVKNCRVNGGIMLEFIIHKSQFTNPVTLICGDEIARNDKRRIRRLSVQSSAEGKIQVERYIGLPGIRSLTIFSGNLSIPLKKTSKLFKKEDCKFLRLLDLEGCRGLDEELFRGICQLVYLKYLSLRNTDVKNIPQEIKKLQCLQTLDIRETQEIKLPIQVIMLPKLAFLFGQFVLPEMSSDAEKFLSMKSELHTLAGFVVDEDGSEHTILKAKNLRKVKVRCRDACVPPKPQTSSITQKLSKLLPRNTRVSPMDTEKDFVSSLQSRFTSLHSVSIDSSQLSQEVLASLKNSRSTISRMKLWGKLHKLPCNGTLKDLTTLSKLQLSYTGLTSDELSALQLIPCLEYLKLQDNEKGFWGGSFVVREDGFESLRRLCFQAAKLPKLEFYTGSMKSLTSLHLLCPDISQMHVAEEVSKSISHITSLSEVILHASATSEIVEAWKTAAKSNVNRPYVNQLQE